jgi:hypothetical protein
MILTEGKGAGEVNESSNKKPQCGKRASFLHIRAL